MIAFLSMRFITAFCFVCLIVPCQASATVYEIAPDGSMTAQEAADYLSIKKQKNASHQSLPVATQQYYDAIIQKASQEHNISPALIHAVILCESDYDPNAISKKGAMGLMQLMPETAMHFRVRNAFDPEENIMAGAQYLSELLRKYNHNTARALAAYNAGEGAVLKYGGIPPYPETQNYVYKVISRMK